MALLCYYIVEKCAIFTTRIEQINISCNVRWSCCWFLGWFLGSVSRQVCWRWYALKDESTVLRSFHLGCCDFQTDFFLHFYCYFKLGVKRRVVGRIVKRLRGFFVDSLIRIRFEEMKETPHSCDEKLLPVWVHMTMAYETITIRIFWKKLCHIRRRGKKGIGIDLESTYESIRKGELYATRMTCQFDTLTGGYFDGYPVEM